MSPSLSSTSLSSLMTLLRLYARVPERLLSLSPNSYVTLPVDKISSVLDCNHTATKLCPVLQNFTSVGCGSWDSLSGKDGTH